MSALGPPQTPPSEVSYLGQEDAVTKSPLCLPQWEGRETQESGTESQQHMSLLCLSRPQFPHL